MTPEQFAELVAATTQKQQNNGYRVWTTDLLTNQKLCHAIPLAIDKFSYGRINTWGEASGTVSLDAPEDPLTVLEDRRTAMWIMRGGQLVWGGIVWDVEPDLRSRTLRVTAQTWTSYYWQRLILDTLSFTGTDQLDIFRGLISYAHAQPSGNIGVTVDSGLSGVLRDRYYGQTGDEGGSPDKAIGEAMQRLAEVPDGFEWTDDWYLDSAGNPRKLIRLGIPQLGGGFSSNLAWEYPGNMLSYTWSKTGKGSPNKLVAPGSGEGIDQLLGVAVNTEELDVGYPLLEASTGTEYRDVITSYELDQHAKEDLRVLARGKFSPTFTVRPDVSPLPGEYGAGDIGRFRMTSCIHRPTATGAPGYDGRLRITSVEVSPERADRAGEALLSTMAVSDG